MADPLADIIALLKPSAPFSKVVRAAGPWRIRRTEVGRVYYCAILSGSVLLEVDGNRPVKLSENDFALVPAACNFAVSSVDPSPPANLVSVPIIQDDGSVRIGPNGPTSAEQLVGYCDFDTPDAAILLSFLPDMAVVRGLDRLATLSQLVADEAREARPAREMMLDHLLQLLLIEALRSTTSPDATPGLLHGLADCRLAPALRAMHAAPDRPWTITEVAAEANLSRSAFFTRFRRIVGVPPMDYLLNWRMTLAKHMLREGTLSVGEIAARTGYRSTSAFSVAFSRETGTSPASFVR